jgi:hypothetical protein
MTKIIFWIAVIAILAGLFISASKTTDLSFEKKTDNSSLTINTNAALCKLDGYNTCEKWNKVEQKIKDALK